MDAVEAAKSGHPGMPMGMAEIALALWRDGLRHHPAHPHWPDRDRFVLSNGHGSMLLYGLLHLTGYDLPIEELKRFRQLHSKTPGHPEHGLTAGVETTTGPLGQGLANAVGMALAERLLAARFNRPGHAIVDHRTYVFVGDGCLMEGISHEAASLAGTWGLGQARRVLRRQRHLDRRRGQGLVHRRHAAPIRSLRLERASQGRRSRRRRGRRGDQGGAGGRREDGPTAAHLLPDDHRQGRADQGRHRRRARRGARREGSGGGTRGARLDVPAVRDSARGLCRRGTRARAAPRSSRDGRSASPPTAPPFRRSPRNSAAAWRASCRRTGREVAAAAFVAANAKAASRRHAQGVAAGDRGARAHAARAPRRLGRPHGLGVHRLVGQQDGHAHRGRQLRPFRRARIRRCARSPTASRCTAASSPTSARSSRSPIMRATRCGWRR